MAEKDDKATPKKATAAPRATKAAAPRTAVRRSVARPVTRAVVRPAVREERAPEAVEEPKPKREPRPLPTVERGHAAVIDASGVVSGSVALPEALVAASRRAGVLFQTLLIAASNAHVGTAATKNRSRVSGGGAKPWRQKGTGRARQGSTRAPHWRHGGVVFGPNGRRYARRIPEKMRREAFAEAFAARATEGRVLLYDAMAFEDGARTRAVLEWLDKIGDTGRVLLVTPGVDEHVARATANAREASVRSVGALRTSDLLTHDTVIVRRDALDALAARAAATGARDERTAEVQA